MHLNCCQSSDMEAAESLRHPASCMTTFSSDNRSGFVPYWKQKKYKKYSLTDRGISAAAFKLVKMEGS